MSGWMYNFHCVDNLKSWTTWLKRIKVTGISRQVPCCLLSRPCASCANLVIILPPHLERCCFVKTTCFSGNDLSNFHFLKLTFTHFLKILQNVYPNVMRLTTFCVILFLTSAVFHRFQKKVLLVASFNPIQTHLVLLVYVLVTNVLSVYINMGGQPCSGDQWFKNYRKYVFQKKF